MEMRKLVLACLGVAILLVGIISAGASSWGHSEAIDAKTLQVRVLDSGHKLQTNAGAVLIVTDPRTLAGHDNQQLIVKCRVNNQEDQVQVTKVLEGFPYFWTDWSHLHYGDSAFHK